MLKLVPILYTSINRYLKQVLLFTFYCIGVLVCRDKLLAVTLNKNNVVVVNGKQIRFSKLCLETCGKMWNRTRMGSNTMSNDVQSIDLSEQMFVI